MLKLGRLHYTSRGLITCLFEKNVSSHLQIRTRHEKKLAFFIISSTLFCVKYRTNFKPLFLAEPTLIFHTVFHVSTVTPINPMSTVFMGPWISKGHLVKETCIPHHFLHSIMRKISHKFQATLSSRTNTYFSYCFPCFYCNPMSTIFMGPWISKGTAREKNLHSSSFPPLYYA